MIIYMQTKILTTTASWEGETQYTNREWRQQELNFFKDVLISLH